MDDRRCPGSILGSYLVGVGPLSSTDVTIAGTTGPDADQEVRTWRWDGAQWHRVPFPQVGGRYGTFEDGIGGVRRSDMWVVGGWVPTRRERRGTRLLRTGTA